VKRGLFLKYVALFIGLVSGVLAVNAAIDLYFVYVAQGNVFRTVRAY
jgi:hypothetical protein